MFGHLLSGLGSRRYWLAITVGAAAAIAEGKNAVIVSRLQGGFNQ
jgi:hypothetical protein